MGRKPMRMPGKTGMPKPSLLSGWGAPHHYRISLSLPPGLPF
jgi:hypothetical protein